MLTLYHAPQSRSSRIVWLLEELGAPYQIRLTDVPRLDGSGAPDPGNPHPDKKVPAIVDDGVLVTESAAIDRSLSASRRARSCPGGRRRGRRRAAW